MLHVMQQSGEIVAYPHPAVFEVKPGLVEVWALAEGEPTLLASYPTPRWRNDCIHEELQCSCVEEQLARLAPTDAEDVASRVKRKLTGGE